MKRIIFVCQGNICRSPMMEQVARAWIDRTVKRGDVEIGLSDVLLDSAGISDEEDGNPIDPRAAQVLVEHGYSAGNHRAKQITRQMIEDAALVFASEPWHIQAMGRIDPMAQNLRLFSDYDPQAAPGSRLPDPWYGGMDGFEKTLSSIEAAMPGVLRAIREVPDADLNSERLAG